MIILRTVTLPAAMVRPDTNAPAPAPFSSISGEVLKPGWVLPLIETGCVIVGSADVRLIVRTPPPGMLKLMTSAAVVAFADVIASRSDTPLVAPLFSSAVVVTTNVAGVTRSSRDSRRKRGNGRRGLPRDIGN